MNKKLLSLLLIFLVNFANAQGIEIYTLEDGATDVSGTIVSITNGEDEMYQTFDVKNVSGVSQTLRIIRKKILELPGTQDYLCWGETDSTGICYPESLVAPYDPWTTATAAELVDGQAGWLKTYHVAEGIDGCAQYRYYVIDDSDDVLDSVDVLFCSTVSIGKDVKVEISVYPNPAADFVSIVMEDNMNAIEFKLFNVLGEVVLAERLIKGKNQVRVEAIPSGVYFYSVFKEGEIIETKKLIVKR